MKSLLFLFVALITLSSFGQHHIKGHISDVNGALPFVNIIVKHTTKGAFTDDQGNFSIKAKSTDTLQVSYLGYKTKTVLAGKQTTLKIVLEDYEALETVMLFASKSRTIHCGTTCHFTCIHERESPSGVSELYPNPSREGVFYLKTIQEFSEVNILVADLTGRIILNEMYKKINSSIIVDLSNQPSGMYIINIASNGKLIASKKAIRI